MKTIFVMSDPHGHYTILKETLFQGGYDEHNPDHLLIICGDMFDRGEESLEMFKYLYRLNKEGKAIILKGNHEPMLESFLKNNNDPFNYVNNGLKNTLGDLMHCTAPFESFCLIDEEMPMSVETFYKWAPMARKQINEEYPELLPWLESLPYYYETKNYIFTHGMIDGICEDWHHPKKDLYGKYLDWDACTWARPEDFKNSIVNTDKTVVVGHIHCGLLRSLYGEDENDNSIFVRPDDKKVIGIDTCTIRTKKINLLIIEDEL